MIVLQPGYDGPLEYPHVAWRRQAGTISATTSASGFAAANAGTPRTDSFWRPTAMPATWTNAFSAAPISYIGIAAHDLATQGCTVTAEVEVSAAWVEVGADTPTDNDPILFLFNEVEATGFRLVITGSGDEPTIAVIQGGRVTAWPRKATFAPSVSMQRATDTGYDTNLTDGGQWAGRSVVRRGLTPSMTVDHLPEQWIAAEFDAFADHARALPFFIADKPGKYPLSLAYAFAQGDLIPERVAPNARVANRVTLDLRGFRSRPFVPALDPVASPALDPDAAAYIAAVEDEAGAPLSAGLRAAHNGLFVRAKADGYFDDIKSMILIGGNPSLASTLVPAIGAAMTAVNFVPADYTPTGGLVGDGSTKYVNSNRKNNDDPQNSQSMWVLTLGFPTGVVMGTNTGSGRSNINFPTPANQMRSRSRTTSQSDGIDPGTGGSGAVHFLGISRGASGSYLKRFSGAQVTVTQASSAPGADDLWLYGREGVGAENATPILAAGIGEHIADLADLEANLRQWWADVLEALA